MLISIDQIKTEILQSLLENPSVPEIVQLKEMIGGAKPQKDIFQFYENVVHVMILDRLCKHEVVRVFIEEVRLDMGASKLLLELHRSNLAYPLRYKPHKPWSMTKRLQNNIVIDRAYNAVEDYQLVAFGMANVNRDTISITRDGDVIVEKYLSKIRVNGLKVRDEFLDSNERNTL